MPFQFWIESSAQASANTIENRAFPRPSLRNAAQQARRRHAARSSTGGRQSALDKTFRATYKPPTVAPSSKRNAQVAQLVEHATENRSVGGSIPPLGTKTPSHGERRPPQLRIGYIPWLSSHGGRHTRSSRVGLFTAFRRGPHGV